MSSILSARTFLKIVSVAAVFGLLVAACGGGGDSGTESADTGVPGSSTTSGAAEEPATTTEQVSTTDAQGPPVNYHEFLEVGVCFDDVGNYVDPVPPVDCALDHEAEIFARAENPAGPEVPYPGDTEMGVFASEEVCDPAYEEFMGVAPELGLLEYSVLRPDESEWERGDRVVICQVEDSEPLVGSVASGGLEIADVVVVSVGRLDGVVDLFAN
ncbi:MAG: septum formation family protein, partial [Acidimicrobiales bacterium]